jgi:hypothetical protein
MRVARNAFILISKAPWRQHKAWLRGASPMHRGCRKALGGETPPLQVHLIVRVTPALSGRS